MLRMLLFSLLVLPLVEIAGLIALGRLVGFWLALAWLGLAGLAGLRILRWQGRRSLQQVAGLTPESRGATDLLNALLVSAAGVLLLFPGPVSDAVAAVLLLPPLRRSLARWLLGKGLSGSGFAGRFAGGVRFGAAPGERQTGGFTVVEGVFSREPGPDATPLPPTTPRQAPEEQPPPG